MTDNLEILAKLRSKLQLPADATRDQVLAAFESHTLRRAALVGLSAAAKLDEIESAERRAVAAAGARRVAAAAMLGHATDPEPEEYHPALRPVGGRTPQNASRSIDWAAIEGGGE